MDNADKAPVFVDMLATPQLIQKVQNQYCQNNRALETENSCDDAFISG
jgi:hypothetical protein